MICVSVLFMNYFLFLLHHHLAMYKGLIFWKVADFCHLNLELLCTVVRRVITYHNIHLMKRETNKQTKLCSFNLPLAMSSTRLRYINEKWCLLLLISLSSYIFFIHSTVHFFLQHFIGMLPPSALYSSSLLLRACPKRVKNSPH